MTILTYENKIEFFQFLIGYKTMNDFEKFIYSQQNLEQQLGSETYLSLIELNFKDKFEKVKLIDIVRNKIIDEGQFETWKLKRILNDFLIQPEKTDFNLDKIYQLYCGVCQDNGQRKYEYKFLGNLGLNYLHWTEESYLKTHYGDNWKTEYEKCKSEFGFYHEQLQNFATEILSAIDSNEIEILNNGTYRISNYLNNKLETDEIYKLKHKNEKYGS